MGSAEVKVDRASHHLDELKWLLSAEKLFTYVADTSWFPRRRQIRAKRNEVACTRTALICGDIVHNLRSALDHVYWDRVSPCVTDPKKFRYIQFPIVDDEAHLERKLKDCSADVVSPAFVQAIRDLRPYRSAVGHSSLWQINELDIRDKHKLLILIGEAKDYAAEELKRQVPDFPFQVSGVVVMGMNGVCDWGWGLPLWATADDGFFAERLLDISVHPFLQSEAGSSGTIEGMMTRLLLATKAAVLKLRMA